MEDNTEFYPMTQTPLPDSSDASFSCTVIIYGTEAQQMELGYYDFEEGQWAHFGKNGFLLKCWCYIPNPRNFLNKVSWEAVPSKGYKANIFDNL